MSRNKQPEQNDKNTKLKERPWHKAQITLALIMLVSLVGSLVQPAHIMAQEVAASEATSVSAPVLPDATPAVSSEPKSGTADSGTPAPEASTTGSSSETSASNTEPNPETTTAASSTTTPAATPGTTSAANTTTTPAADSTTTSAANTTTTPAADSTTPAANTTTTPAADSTTPAANTTTTPAANTTTTPAADPTTPPAANSATTPAADPTTTPASNPSTTPSADPTTTSASNSATLPAADPTTTSASNSPTTPGADPTTTPAAEEPAVSKDSDFIVDPETKTLAYYKGTATIVNIPVAINGVAIEHIREGVFYDKKLTKVTLPEGLKSIGKNAFGLNKIETLAIPATLETIDEGAFALNSIKTLTFADKAKLQTIGKEAFKTNKLTSFTAPAELKTIGEMAFYNNELTTVTLNEGLTTIGNQAFAKNDITTSRTAPLMLPQSLTAYGENVFADNNKYVLTDGSAQGKTYTLTGHFGEIYKAVAIKLIGKDEDTQKVVLSERLVEPNIYEEHITSQLMAAGQTVTIVPPPVPGYIGKNFDLTLTPEEVAKVHTALYKTTAKDPVIEGLTPIHINLNEPLDLKKGVTARDDLGNDLTESIVIKPDKIDTQSPSQYKVEYSVTDAAGRKTVRYRIVMVGVDPMDVEVGNGWIMRDFRFGGNTVTGLSSSGREKAKINRNLILPTFNPTVPERTPITMVSSAAFYNNSFETLKIPEGYKEIGPNAFAQNLLRAVSFPQSLTAIQSAAFASNQLVEIALPDTLTTLGASAFEDNILLSAPIPSKLTSLSDRVYKDNNIQSVAIPEHITAIGNSAFENNKISALALSEGLTSIGSKAFMNNQIAALNFPASLTTLGTSAFEKNLLTYIEIPNTITTFGDYIFRDNKIVTYKLPTNIDTIPKGLFATNKILKLVIPDYITKIGADAFSRNQIMDLTIPGHVTEIGDYALSFNHYVDNFKLNEGLVKIGNYAFRDTAIKVDELVMPSTVRSIGAYAFTEEVSQGKLVIKKLVLNDGLESLGDHAFYNVYIRELRLPESLTVIPSYAFAENGISTINIPKTVTSIGDYAFYKNKALEVNIPRDSVLQSIGAVAFNSNQIKGIFLPETLTTLGSSALASNRIESIKLPESLTSAGSGALSSNQLTELVIPSKITTIPENFASNNLLQKLVLHDKVTRIENSAFYNNLLPEVQLPDGLTYIGSSAFSTNKLSNLIIPDSVTEIGSGAFSTNNLQNVKLSENLTRISYHTFYGNKLKSITIPAKVTEIRYYAFNNNQLSEIEFAENSQLSSISYAFQNNQFTEVHLPQSVTYLDSGAFSQNPGNAIHGMPQVAVYIQDAEGHYINPHNLTDSSYHRINPAIIQLKKYYMQGQDKVPAGVDEYIFGKLGQELRFKAPFVVGYLPKEDKEYSLTPEEKTTVYEIEYVENPAQTAEKLLLSLAFASGNEYDSANPHGKRSYWPNQAMPLVIRFKYSTDLKAIEEPWLTINLNKPSYGGYVELRSDSWPTNWKDFIDADENGNPIFFIEDGVLKIKLNKQKLTTSVVDIPIKLYFKYCETPHDFELDLTNALLLHSGKPGAPGTKTYVQNDPYQLILRRLSEDHSFYKSTPTSSPSIEVDKEGYVAKGKEQPIKFNFSMGWSYYQYKHRYIDKVKIIDTIPTYTGKDPVTGEERTDLRAKFHPELSGAWKVNPDNKNEIILEESFPRTYSSQDFTPAYFSFPGAKANQTIYNNASAEFFPNEPGDKTMPEGATSYQPERTEKASASTSLYFYAESFVEPTPPPGTEPRVEIDKRCKDFHGDNQGMTIPGRSVNSDTTYYGTSEGNISYSSWYDGSWISKHFTGGHYFNKFRDSYSEKSREFLWGLQFRTFGKNMQNPLITDYGLDSRMRYSAIRVPAEMGTVTVTFFEGAGAAYGADESTLGQQVFQTTIRGDRYDIPEDVSRRARSFTLKFNNYSLEASPYTDARSPVIEVYTRLIDPTAKLCNSSYGTDFYNKVSIVADQYNHLNQHSVSKSADESEYIRALPDNSVTRIQKTLITVGDKNYSNQNVAPNEALVYRLDIMNFKSKDDQLVNLKALDLLPPLVTPRKLIFSDAFMAKTVNPRYELIPNFEGTGRWAIAIYVDSYNNGYSYSDSYSEFAKVYAETDPNLENRADGYVNDFFLTAESSAAEDAFWKRDAKPENAKFDFFKDAKTVLHASAKFETMLAQGLLAFKQIKPADSDTWHSRGIWVRSEGEFDYRLNVTNMSSSESPNNTIENVEIIDVLPYSGDHRIVRNEYKNFIDRGTNLRQKAQEAPPKVSMTGPVVYIGETEGVTQDSFEYRYSMADPNESFKDKDAEQYFDNESLWLTAEQVGNNWDKVTAIKIYSKPGVQMKAGWAYDFKVPMKAPVNLDYMYDGMHAVNSFAMRARKDESMNNFVEVNNVEVVMASPTAMLTVHKLSEKKTGLEPYTEPLPGAEFMLYTVAKDFDPAEQVMTLPGSEYKVLKDPVAVNINGKTLTALTTDSRGLLTFDGLKFVRDYVLVETKIPTGHMLMPGESKYHLVKGEDLKKADQSHVTLEIKNLYTKWSPITPLEASFSFGKVDVNGYGLPYTGFKLRGITDENRHVSEFRLSDKDGKVTFDHLGLYPHHTKLPNYILEETNPRGALQPIAPMYLRIGSFEGKKTTVVVTDEHGTALHPEQEGIPDILNDKATLKVVKLGIHNLKYQKLALDKLSQQMGRRLNGVKIQLLNSEGALVEEQTTDLKGEVFFKNLKLNTVYYLVEPKDQAAAGDYKNYVEEDGSLKRIKVEIDQVGRVKINDKVGEHYYSVFPNYPKKNTNRVDILKSDQYFGMTDAGEDNLIAGAVFDLYKITVGPDGQEVATLKQTATTNKAGQATFENFAMTTGDNGAITYETGTFEIREREVPKGYLPRFKPFRFTTNDEEVSVYNLEAVNPLIELVVDKYEERGDIKRPLPGAVFALYEGDKAVGSPIKTVTTDTYGKADFKGFRFDTAKKYALKEITAPAGYLLSDRVEVIDLPGLVNNVTFNGMLKYEWPNEKIQGSLVISKMDSFSRNPLEGVTFSVTDTTAEKPEPVRLGKTNAQGVVMFTGLTLGKTYKVQETATKTGYVLSDQVWTVTVNDNEELRVNAGNDRTPGQLLLVKSDELGRFLKGVEFKLEKLLYGDTYGVAAEKLTTDDKGEILLKDLSAGSTYRLTETSNQNATPTAEGGYAASGKIWYIKVSDTSNVTVQAFEEGSGAVEVGTPLTITNIREGAPKTRLDVRKIWQGGIADGVRPLVKAVLYQRTQNGEWTLYSGENTKTLTKDQFGVYSASFENLPKDYPNKETKAYELYEYKVEELLEGQYKEQYASKVTGGWNANYNSFVFTFENTYTVPNNTTFKATKSWVNGSETRTPVTLQLMSRVGFTPWKAVGTPVTLDGVADTVAAGANGELEAWVYTWKNLPETDSNGYKVEYKVVEQNPPANYKVSVSDAAEANHVISQTVTNTYESPANTRFIAEKVWKDNFETHAAITLQLQRRIANGEWQNVGEAVTLDGTADGTAANVSGEKEPYQYVWFGLAVTDERANAYEYRVAEGVKPAGYATVYGSVQNIKDTLGLKTDVFSQKITNSWQNESFTVTKNWVKGELLERPQIEVTLFRQIEGGKPEAVPNSKVTLPGPDGQWTHTWNSLASYDANDKKYTYSVQETKVPANYTASVTGNVITNTYVPPTDVTFVATKAWVGKPSEGRTVTLQLKQIINNVASDYGDEVVLNGKTDTAGGTSGETAPWVYTWTKLPATDDQGNKCTYRVEEAAVPNGFAVTLSDVAETADKTFSQTVTNTWRLKNIEGRKIWNGGSAVRPEKLEIELFRNLNGVEVKIDSREVSAANNWSYKFENLDVCDEKSGLEYKYRVAEKEVPANFEQTFEGDNIINTYKVPTEFTFTVNKAWVGKTGTLVKMQLMQTVNGRTSQYGDAVTLKDNWSYTWTGLPETDGDGHACAYFVRETEVAKGFDAAYGDVSLNGKAFTQKVTNTWETVDVSGTKSWLGGETLRPASVEIALYRKAAGGAETLVGTKTVSEAEKWQYSWTGLDKYDGSGQEYVYRVAETTVTDDFNAVVTGYNIENIYQSPEETIFVATKKWNDKFNFHPTIELQLWRQAGTAEAEKVFGPVTLNGEKDAQGELSPYAYTWTGLKKADNSGVPYKYFVTELTTLVGYDTTAEDPVKTVDAENAKLEKWTQTITNTWKTRSFSVEKKWQNGEAIAKGEITLVLYKGLSQQAMLPVDTIKLNASTGWTHTWTGLDEMNNNGDTYLYDVRETAGQTDFTASYEKTDGKVTVTNTYTSPKTDIEATKTWVGGDASNRPAVTFELWRRAADGTEVMAGEAKTLLNGQPSVTWTGLDKTDAAGKAYTYFVKETTDLDNYTKNENGLNVTNTYVIPHDGKVSATKIWVNGDAANRPDIQFKLYRKVAGGQAEAVPGAEVKTLTKGTTKVEWTGLEVTDGNGKPYIFSVKEVAEPANYEASYSEDGLTVTNTYKVPKTAEAQATKIWVNGDAANRPDIQFKLYRKVEGGSWEAVPNASVLTLVNGVTSVRWTALEATDLAGKPYQFSVQEVAEPANYEASYSEDGLTVTNTYKIPKTGEAEATKVWVNGDDTKRPEIQFELYRKIEGGVAEKVPNAETKTLKNGETKVKWTGLDKTDVNGKPYSFSVKEVAEPANYEASYSADGLTVTNTYKVPNGASFKATKLWSGKDETGRVVSLSLLQYLGDYSKVYGTIELDGTPDQNGETAAYVATWTGLPETDLNGQPYRYEVRETAAPSGYEPTYGSVTAAEDGKAFSQTVTNVWQTVEVSGTKTWYGGESLDKGEVEITLYRKDSKGETKVDAVTLTEKTGWSYSWTNLDKFNNNYEEYTYRVAETKGPANFTPAYSGYNVSNVYTTPTDVSFVATKQWDGGETRPEISLQLWRVIPNGKPETVGQPVALDGTPGGQEIGPFTALWTNLDKTDGQGNAYSYYVTEVAEPAGYKAETTGAAHTGSSWTQTITNVWQTTDVSVTKEWVNGDAAKRPQVDLTLYRKVENGKPEKVESVTLDGVAEVTGETTPWIYTWTGLDKFSSDGKLYIYYVEEAAVDNYSTAYQPGKVINTYVVPKNGEAEATKVWVNGDAANRPEISFELYRQVAGGQPEKVPGAAVKTLKNGETKVKWTGLDETDINGKPYSFSVKEVAVPANYEASYSEDGLTVTNTYVIPKNGEAEATKVWVNGDAANRPEIQFKLYRKITGGELEEVPGADVKTLKNGETKVKWTGLDETDSSGRTYTFFVKEITELAHYAKTEDGLTVTNTYEIPKTGEAVAQKIWVNGDKANRPEIRFELYRRIKGGQAEKVPGAEIKTLKNGETQVKWTGLDATNSAGQPYTFSVKEVEVPANYKESYSEDGLKVTNTYVIPSNGEAEAQKLWVKGPAPRPTVWFRLWREAEGTAAEPVPNAPIKALENGTVKVKWTGLEETNAAGQPYTFFVKEVAADGSELKLDNYKTTEVGLAVTNTYVIPKDAEAVATKVWKNGPTPRPTISFELYRMVTGGELEKVPDAPIKTLVNGVTEVKWTGLDRTNENGEVYTFYVKEVGKPDNYEKTEDGLKVTNSYVIPNDGVVKAYKEWVGGSAVRPDIQFRLYRQIAGGQPEAVPGAAVKTLTAGMTEVVWTGLETTDLDGNPYIFSVREISSLTNFDKSQDGLTVTNTYVIPKNGEAKAVKTWTDGPDTHPTVWFKLYRKVADGTPEAVPGAAIKELKNGVTEVKWTGLDETDGEGRPYTFLVQEVTADGKDYTPDNYVKTENGLTVNNTYVSPQNAVAKAEKVWKGGPTPRPTVWFKLYRHVEGGAEQEVPNAGLKKLVNGTTEVVWTGLDKTDSKGNEYIYTVKEVASDGSLLKLDNYTSEAKGLTVTNTYVIPNEGSAKAEKVWKGGSAAHPTVWFELWRKTETGTAEPVLNAEIKELKNGVTQVTWTGLDETDGDGNVYTFFVKEVNAAGEDFVPTQYTKTESGLMVTNTYKVPQNGEAKATKKWVNGPDEHPAITFELWRQIDGGTPMRVPEAERKTLVNGVTEVTWTGLDETDFFGNPYTFFVKEVGTPVNYEKTEKGLTVTNSYVIPKTEAKAYKVWVNGPAERPMVKFELWRQLAGGKPEAVPEAAIKELKNGVTEVVWTNLDATDLSGNAYSFFVKEVGTPDDYQKTEKGLVVFNSYIIPTDASAKAEKIWKNGPEKHPVIAFRLYREIEGEKAEPVPGAEVKELKDGVTTVEWTGLEKTDINGRPYIFSVKEVETPQNYKKTESGLTVTNEYLIPLTDVRAAKAWIGGDETARPEIQFRLYRQLEGGKREPVPGAEVKTLKNGVTEVIWKNLDKTDLSGSVYTYTVEEVTVPENYKKTESGLKVTNEYVIPTDASAKAEKIWKNGPAEHPTVKFELWRQTEGGKAEAVPGAAVKELKNGVTTVEWTGLERTDFNGKPYTFFVKEVETPANYKKTESGLKVTNEYVIPTDASAKAEKIWKNGPAEHPTVKFELWRQTEGGKPEAVPGAEIKELKNGVTTAEWTGLERTDVNGKPYTFFVKEVETPANYKKTEDGLKVTNEYVIPTDASAKAEKIWKNGPAEHPTVKFELWRQTEGGKPEAVPGAEIKELKNGVTTAEWTGLERTDINGKPYTFFVKEVETPVNYRKTEDGLKVTNEYVIPQNGEAKAEKIWKNGAEERPDIWFKLYRQLKDGKPEAVPGAEIKELKSGVTTVEWTGLEATDLNGNFYTFSVKEVDKDGKDFTPEHYKKTEDGLKVTNEYIVPTDGTLTVKKVWADTVQSYPAIELQLVRDTADGKTEKIGEPVKLDGKTDKWTHTWTGLEVTDLQGRPYTYRAEEVNVPTGYGVSYSTEADGTAVVTNTWKTVDITAKKTWIGGDENARPEVELVLYRTPEGGKEETIGAIKLNGEADDWTYTWKALDSFTRDGKAYTYRVEEKGVPEGYEVSYNGYEVINTYVPPTPTTPEEPGVTKTGESGLSQLLGLAMMGAAAGFIQMKRKKEDNAEA